MSTFAELGLSEKTLAAVEELGYTEPTPVQEQAIPLVLEGRDIIAAAKTGTGKTAAFSLPGMDTLPHRAIGESGPFMLVLTPTRELASQIGETCMPIGKHTEHFVAMFVGGVKYDPQIKKLERGIDVAIATPGRLIDLMERGAVDLSAVRVLVLDEADRMLDMGFWPQVERIVKETPDDRQTLLFSATIDRSQDKTMFSLLNDPAIVEIAHRGDTADKVDQYVIHTTRRQKPELLNALIKEKGGFRVIVFTRTKGGADNATKRLRRAGIPTEAIHADRSQAQRTRALENFRTGKTNVLVATDVLARGIDVSGVDYVVNYDLPMMPEDYVHRIGRTGRAGADGLAISLVTPETKSLLKGIQKFIGKKIDEMDYKVPADAFDPLPADDPRIINQERIAEEERRAAAEKRGSSKTEGKRGRKRKMRGRDIERAEEHKKRKAAEAEGREYVAPARPKREKSDRPLTLEERQARAEAQFNAMFDIPNIEGGKRKEAGRDAKEAKRKSKRGGEHTYSYEQFSRGKRKGQAGAEARHERGRDYDFDRKGRKNRDFDGGFDGEFGGEGDRKTRGKKYSSKQYSDGRGAKPGKKTYGAGAGAHGRKGSYAGARSGSSDGFRTAAGDGKRSGKGAFQRSGKGGFGGKGGQSRTPRGDFNGRGKSEFRPGRSNRNAGGSRPASNRGGMKRGR